MKKTDLTLCLRRVRPHRAPPGPAAALRLLVWTLGLSLLLRQNFPSLPLLCCLLPLASLALHAALCLLPPNFRRSWLLPGALCLLGILCFLLRAPLWQSAGTLCNDLLSNLRTATGRIYLDFSAARPPYFAFFALFALCFSLSHAALLRRSVLPLLPILAALAAGYFCGALKPGAGLPVCLLGALLLLDQSGDGGRAVLARALCTLAAIALCLLSSLLLRDLPLTTWQTQAARTLHALRYDSKDAAMPEGDFSDLGPLQASDAPALRVTMQSPQKLYLRGLTLDTYTGSGWTSADRAQLAQRGDLFYWLHARGFYGQSQIALASSQVQEQTPWQLEITCLSSACRGHAYLPYALCQTQALDARAIGDATQRSPISSMTCLEGSLPQWYAVQNALSQNQSELQDYLSCENAYRAWVQETDLQLTSESFAVLQRQLGAQGESLTLPEILTRIRSYLSSQLRYDKTVYTPLGGDDFLHYTLERSGAGYSVHYATAAVLMLRYFGVPARYVEGYYLTPEQAAQAEAGEPVTLTEQNAHAWAEYYLNGVGFVPFEVTPGYLDEADVVPGSGEDTSGAQALQQQYTAAQQYSSAEQPDTPAQQDADAQGGSTLRPWPLLLLLPLLLFLFLLQRRVRLLRALRRIDRAPDREAIALRYGYALYLLRYLPGAPPEALQAAQRLNEEACFSTHVMTAQQRAQMDGFAAELLALCKARWNLPQRLYYHLILCIY